MDTISIAWVYWREEQGRQAQDLFSWTQVFAITWFAMSTDMVEIGSGKHSCNRLASEAQQPPV